MSAGLESDAVVADIGQLSGRIEIREGDWQAYLSHIEKCRGNPHLANQFGTIHEYKRACALAYLGKRAQLYGGVCSTRHPHIMTEQYIASLAESNRTRRFARYPWLRALMNLLAEIEQIQDQISASNVVSLVPASK